MNKNHALTAVGFLLVGLFALQSAAAQDSTAVTVNAREKRELVSSTEPITVPDPPVKLRGTVEVLPSAQGTPAKFTLFYTAPATLSVFTETISYTNPTAKTVTVTVVPDGSEVYSEAFKILFIAFVIALVLESSLAILFNWRPFLAFFDGRGVKTLISVVIAYVFVCNFELDLITRLVNVYSQHNPPYPNGRLGYAISALLIAGGSAAVNNVLVGLGFRSVRTAEESRPKPPKTAGWVSVTHVREKAVGPVTVLVGDPTAVPVAGTVVKGRNLPGFLRFFIRDPSRFPQSGGFEIEAGKQFTVELHGKDDSGKDLPPATWGPETMAAGGIIDITLKL